MVGASLSGNPGRLTNAADEKGRKMQDQRLRRDQGDELQQRMSRREDWLAEPEHPEPAFTEETRYVPAPAKVQAFVQEANRRGIRVVSHAEFQRLRCISRPGTTGRAPRRATNARTSGSRRAGASSSTSSSDPGEGESDEPPSTRQALSPEASEAMEAAFLRVLRRRHGRRVHPLRDHLDAPRDRASTTGDDD